jgi:thioredoxin-related protein
VVDKKLENFNVCEVVKYDADEEENDEIISKYGIRNLPTMILVDGEGKELKRWVGVIADMEGFKNEIRSFNA